MKKDERQRRTCYLKVRLTPDELSRVRALMDNAGYNTISCFIRDLIVKKRFSDHREGPVINDKILLEKVNYLIYQVNKIGVNYNQVVALWQKESKMVKVDGTPWINTRSVEERLDKLMRNTERLRDELAVILDTFDRYLGKSPNQ